MKPLGLRARATLASVLFSAVGVAWLVAGPIRSEPGAVRDEALPSGIALLERASDQPIRPAPLLGPGGAVLVVFFVDGLGAAPFEDLLAEGALPSVTRLLTSRPTWRGRARASFPSSTAPNVPELLTGSWSHRLGGMPDAIHALDREKLRLVRYEVERAGWDGLSQTLFDRVQGAGGTSFSYFEGYFPGASLNVHDELLYLMDTARAARRHDLVVEYDDRSVDDLARRMRAAEVAPNLIFLRLGAVDTAGHFYGPASQSYRDAVVATDSHLGEVLDVLGEARLPDGAALLDAATIVLVSDHGMVETERHLDLDRVFETVGLSPWPTSTPAAVLASELNAAGIEDHDVVAVPNGSNLASIYLRDRGPIASLPWSKAPDPGLARRWSAGEGPPVDLVALLLAEPGVAWVSTRDGANRFTVHGRAGALHLERRYLPGGDWALAAWTEGVDPFDFCGGQGAPCCPAGPPADACFLDLPAWRLATVGGPWPELPLLLVKAYSGPEQRRPDLLVEAAPGYGFMDKTHGDHGGLAAALREVPLLVSGPRIDPQAAPVDARLIDVLPTVMPLLGLAPPTGIDGVALPVLRAEHDAGVP